MTHQPTPPYLPFSTFLTALDRLAQAVPTQISRDVFASASGLLKGQIMIALRFFDLIDVNGFPKGNSLERLAKEKSTSSRRANIRRLVLSSYKEVMKFDLTKMSPAQLDAAFQRYHVQGDTKKKAKTFFIKAAQFAELDLSPLLTSRTRSGRRQATSQITPSEAAKQSGGQDRIFLRKYRFPDGIIVTLEAMGDLGETHEDTLLTLSSIAKQLKAKSSQKPEGGPQLTEGQSASD
jgi:hypothetical protein